MMRIKIGKYVDYIGPYQIAEKLLFWMDKYKDDRVHDFGHWLAGDDKADSILMKVCSWVQTKRHREVKVRIDSYDTWSMDGTLAIIILPMLKQLKATHHGAPFVEHNDVPKELRPKVKPNKDNGYVDETHFQRWDWVLDEMIWTFEQLQPEYDWEQQYHSGEIDIVWVHREDGMSEMTKGPKDTREFDSEGYSKHQKRINNGTRLLGVYFQNLWD